MHGTGLLGAVALDQGHDRTFGSIAKALQK